MKQQDVLGLLLDAEDDDEIACIDEDTGAVYDIVDSGFDGTLRQHVLRIQSRDQEDE